MRKQRVPLPRPTLDAQQLCRALAGSPCDYTLARMVLDSLVEAGFPRPLAKRIAWNLMRPTRLAHQIVVALHAIQSGGVPGLRVEHYIRHQCGFPGTTCPILVTPGKARPEVVRPTGGEDDYEWWPNGYIFGRGNTFPTHQSGVPTVWIEVGAGWVCRTARRIGLAIREGAAVDTPRRDQPFRNDFFEGNQHEHY